MGGGMHIGTVLNLDGVVRGLHKTPKLVLYIRLCDHDIAETIHERIVDSHVIGRRRVIIPGRRMRLEPHTPKGEVPGLET
jgi:hypothetical protein